MTVIITMAMRMTVFWSVSARMEGKTEGKEDDYDVVRLPNSKPE